ncbi:hypothetical protein ACQI4L_09015 [Mycolicibacterium litorale]|uniref:hypothetical protein n=1 Tax=Mycolicibacterium litorale TaxID=758802 RepID=UPI003CEE02B1
MTVQIKIPGVQFSDADQLPVIRADSILPAAGALLLIDPTHPVGAWAAGVPAHDAAVPNIAWQQAAAVLGSGTQESLEGSIYSVGMAGAQGLVERTARGGLHAIISPTVAFTDATVGYNVAAPQAIADYIRANPLHKYYGSIWHRVTRVADASFTTLFSTVNTDTMFAMTFARATNLAQAGGKDGEGAIDDTTGGNRFRNMAATPGSGYATDPVVNATNFGPGPRSIFLVGNRHNVNGTSSSGARRGKGGSRIFYRYYLEDLTVSGRSYAAVDALDRALFAQLCNTDGGRYHGDTFTDPAAIP